MCGQKDGQAVLEDTKPQTSGEEKGQGCKEGSANDGALQCDLATSRCRAGWVTF